MTVKITPDPRIMPNGVVLLLGVRYDFTDRPGGDTRGRTNPTVYTYAALKTAGVWYVTGSGKVPTAAGWGAVERWLERDGRVLVSVDVLGLPRRIWPEMLTAAKLDEPDLSSFEGL